MKQISKKIKTEFDIIKIKTINEIYFVAIITLYAIVVVGSYFSLNSTIMKTMAIFVFGVLTVVGLLSLRLLKKSNASSGLIMRFYFSMALIYTLLFSVFTINKYMVTANIVIAAMIIIIYHIYSKKMILALTAFSMVLVGYFGLKGVGNTIEIGYGYVFTTLSSYVLIAFVLTKGVKMVADFDGIYLKQLEKLKDSNTELALLNEEYLASEETLKDQYYEIEQLNGDINRLNDFLKSIIAVTEDGFLTINMKNGDCVFYNDIEKILGVDRVTLINGIPDISKFISPEYHGDFKAQWESITEGRSDSEVIELQYENGGGRYDLKITMVRAVQQEGNFVVVISVKNINERKSKEREIMYMLKHDLLTKALNWNGLIQVLSHKIEVLKEKKFILIMLNIDNFTFINNSFGYEIGDEIVKSLINVLSHPTYGFDNVSRPDGNIIALTASDEETLEGLNEKFDHVFNAVQIKKSKFRIQASIGVAKADHCASVSELVRNAEMAMFHAKDEGKNNIAAHDAAFVKKMDMRYRIFSLMDEAIDQNEFFNVYQPKVDISSGKIIGFESLARWQSKELGFISPSDFIEVAEETNLIVKLGAHMFLKALSFAKTVAEADKDLVTSINVSARQLMDPQFIEKIREMMTITGVHPNNISFEVTETAYMKNMTYVGHVLQNICDMGIKIELDDFGTGYSSLGYISKLPISTLKIDRSFIVNIEESNASQKLLYSTIHLAKNLELKTVAEGVETLGQLKLLKQYGCDIIQGYYFDKPLPEQEAVERILSGHIYDSHQ